MVDDLVILYRFVSKTEITEWLVKCYDKQISGKGREREEGRIRDKLRDYRIILW